ncbi:MULTISPECIES: acyl carrier protein [Oxalobacteraceae]|jgi:acyl carrier protein|uniref:acyl carrier protein n=1 Tax=Oxalobacteraceae TaxID=75682 RepID=UPI0010A2D01E|nr:MULTISPECIES: acyl carrier protein [Oxalobacteraceae]HJV79437.1 acyl carrier protein [Noviherbaspirillum sp.]
MQLANIKEKIAACLEKNLETDKQKLMSDTPFSELDYDSLTMAEVIFMLEDEFNVKFDNLSSTDYPTNLTELAKQMLQLMPAASMLHPEAQQC